MANFMTCLLAACLAGALAGPPVSGPPVPPDAMAANAPAAPPAVTPPRAKRSAEPTRVSAGPTGEAALAQPRVHFELRDTRSGLPLRRRSDPLKDLLGAPAPVAFIDTGASGHVFSPTTTEAYRVRRDGDARYVEVGMAGDHAMAVSTPYDLIVQDHPEAERPQARRSRRRANDRRAAVVVELNEQRLLLNAYGDQRDRELVELLGALGGAVDVIGMPALRGRRLELQPDRATDDAVPARFLAQRERVRADVWIPLRMQDFNRRRDPRNRRPLPTLEENPMITGVMTRRGAATATGAWLLDTGSAVTVISTRTAQSLGLLDGAGAPTHAPAFEMPLGGIAGSSTTLPGFVVDAIEIRGEEGIVVFPEASVVVHDIRTKPDGRREVTLDGILGMNLLLPSGAGFTGIGFERRLASSCTRVVVDLRRMRLGLALRAPQVGHPRTPTPVAPRPGGRRPGPARP